MNGLLGLATPTEAPASGRIAHPVVERVLHRLLADYPEHFPLASSRPTLGSLRVMSRRLSDVARVELRVGARLEVVYIKIHKHPSSTPERIAEKAQREFTTLSDLHARMQAIPGCGVARPIAFFPEERAVVTAELRGDNLYQTIKSGVRRWSRPSMVQRLAHWCEGSGVWLRHFQAITRQPAPAPVPAPALIAHVERLLDAGGPLALPANLRARLVDFCHRQLGGVDGVSFPVVGAHPDFQPDNIVVGPDGITVLDFTSFRYSPPCSDVARFIAALEFLPKNPLYSARALRTLEAAFLRGYGWQRSELEGPLTVYVLRYVLLAATSLTDVTPPTLVRSLMRRRTRRFLATWCRQFLAGGSTHVLRV